MRPHRTGKPTLIAAAIGAVGGAGWGLVLVLDPGDRGTTAGAFVFVGANAAIVAAVFAAPAAAIEALVAFIRSLVRRHS